MNKKNCLNNEDYEYEILEELMSFPIEDTSKDYSRMENDYKCPMIGEDDGDDYFYILKNVGPFLFVAYIVVVLYFVYCGLFKGSL